MDLTIYLVGTDAEDAAQNANFPFDSAESAEDYACDNDGVRVFSVTARIDLDTIEQVGADEDNPRCAQCQVPEHDVCPLDNANPDGCPCCRATLLAMTED